MSVCSVCDKRPGFGNNVARTGRKAIKRRVRGRTSRRFGPNIQSVRVAAGGGTTKLLQVCTSCIKAGKVARAAHV